MTVKEIAGTAVVLYEALAGTEVVAAAAVAVTCDDRDFGCVSLLLSLLLFFLCRSSLEAGEVFLRRDEGSSNRRRPSLSFLYEALLLLAWFAGGGGGDHYNGVGG